MLIRDKKKFEHFTPNDVLGRIVTFDLQREEALERRKLRELQARLVGMKIKDVALKDNKSTKAPSTIKSRPNKYASTSKPKASKTVKEEIESTSSSSEDESDSLLQQAYHSRFINPHHSRFWATAVSCRR